MKNENATRRHEPSLLPNETTDRRQFVRGLRLLGFSYGEISDLVPVAKSTISAWCGDIRLTPSQELSIRNRTGPRSRSGSRVDTQWKRRVEIERIRAGAKRYLLTHLDDPVFTAGVCLYWGEGSKTRNDLSITNTDPQLLTVFIAFVREHLDENAEFALALNLHNADSEDDARKYWRSQLALPHSRFTKSYIKKPGTGHRRKRLPHGVCRVRVDKASDHWHRLMQWIDDLGAILGA